MRGCERMKFNDKVLPVQVVLNHDLSEKEALKEKEYFQKKGFGAPCPILIRSVKI